MGHQSELIGKLSTRPMNLMVKKRKKRVVINIIRREPLVWRGLYLFGIVLPPSSFDHTAQRSSISVDQPKRQRPNASGILAVFSSISSPVTYSPASLIRSVSRYTPTLMTNLESAYKWRISMRCCRPSIGSTAATPFRTAPRPDCCYALCSPLLQPSHFPHSIYRIRFRLCA